MKATKKPASFGHQRSLLPEPPAPQVPESVARKSRLARTAVPERVLKSKLYLSSKGPISIEVTPITVTAGSIVGLKVSRSADEEHRARLPFVIVVWRIEDRLQLIVPIAASICPALHPDQQLDALLVTRESVSDPDLIRCLLGIWQMGIGHTREELSTLTTLRDELICRAWLAPKDSELDRALPALCACIGTPRLKQILRAKHLDFNNRWPTQVSDPADTVEKSA